MGLWVHTGERQGKYSACIIIAAACWGLTGFFNRTLTAYGFSAPQILFIRCIVPLVLLGIYCLIVDRNAFYFKLRDLWCFLGSGLLSLTMFGFAYMRAMQVMDLSVAVVLLYTSPIWVVLLSAKFFRERITRPKVLALCLVAVGAVLTTGMLAQSPRVTPFGLLLGLISGFGYGLYSIFTRFAYLRGYSSRTVTFYTFLFSTLAVGAVADVPGMIDLTLNSVELGAADVTGPAWVIGLWQVATGVVTCLVPYSLYTKGLQGVSNGKASILATVEIVVSTIVSVAVFGEAFTWMNLVGMILVIGGVAVMNLDALERKH